jgi:hypothetical protein
VLGRRRAKKKLLRGVTRPSADVYSSASAAPQAAGLASRRTRSGSPGSDDGFFALGGRLLGFA